MSRLKANPALRRSEGMQWSSRRGTMTRLGTWSKVLFLLVLVISAAVSAFLFVPPSLTTTVWIASALITLVLSLFIVFRAGSAKYLAPVYAVVEGVFVGTVSLFFEQIYPGIVVDAVLATFFVFWAMWLVYANGFIKVTNRFRAGVSAAILAILFLYLVQLLLSLFGGGLPFLTGSSPLAIGIQFVIVIVASLSLVLDFDYIDEQIRYGAPKESEWYAAFGLLVSLVWLYIEILDLLARLARRD